MAMTKKERELVERLLTLSALRITADVLPDVPLYSTKMRALLALRREVEQDCMARLRKVDQMIEAHEVALG